MPKQRLVILTVEVVTDLSLGELEIYVWNLLRGARKVAVRKLIAENPRVPKPPLKLVRG